MDNPETRENIRYKRQTKQKKTQHNIDNQHEEHYADPTNKTFNRKSVIF